MPSGSHMTSGGSHFSGGGSSRSSSSSSSSSSSHSSGSYHSRGSDDYYHTHHHYGHRHVYGYGATYYAPLSLKGFFIVLLSIVMLTCIALIVVFSVGMSSYKDLFNKMQTDYDYYQAMCRRAMEDSDYMTTATVNDCFYNEDAGKFYVTYTFSGYNGESFSVYTSEEAYSMVDRVYDLAINTKKTNINVNTDSILMDYYGMPISKDGEYAKVMHSRNVRIVLIVVFSVGIVLCMALIVIIEKKMIKSKETDAGSSTSSKKSDDTSDKTSSKWKCRYCGAMNADSSDRCKGCGSRHPNSK